MDIPNSVTAIGNSAFWYCKNLSTVKLPTELKIIGEKAFSDCLNLGAVNIPNSVTYIGESAFRHCKNLTTAIVSDSLKIIPEGLFCDCRSLSSVNIPQTAVDIGAFAFWGCPFVAKIPSSVTSIGPMAFYRVVSLICFAPIPPKLDPEALSDCYNVSLHVLSGCKKVYKRAKYWKKMNIIEDVVLK